MTLFANPQYNRNENGYIKVPTDPEMCSTAWERAKALGALNHSIRGGTGNLVGYLGQMAVEKAIVGMKREDTYDYDLIYDDNGEKRTADVKTKDRTIFPLPHYECSISEYNTEQATDYYIFASTYRIVGTYDYSLVFVLGYIEKTEYFKKARFLQKGDIDPSNNFAVRANCYNLAIKDLLLFE